MTAAVVCPGSGTGPPSPVRGWSPPGGALWRVAGARARAVAAVCRSAQRSAGRSVQPRSQGRCAAGLPPPCAGLPGDVLAPVGAATRSNRCCALPHLTAPLGAPKAGTGAAALCPCRGFLPPHNPLQGALRIAERSWGSAAVPLVSLVLCGLSSLRASVWNVMPQGPCVKAWPRGRAPAGRLPRSDRQRGQEAVPGRLRCWRTRSASPVRAGDRRRTRVPDEALAVAGGPCGGNVPPRPSWVAALPG